MSIVVVDYSKGNLRSVQKGLELAGATALISADARDIVAAKAIVLPGVGSFASASRYMLESGQMQAIRERVGAGVPFLGICLGLQLMFERGNEGLPEGAAAGVPEGTPEDAPDGAPAGDSPTNSPPNHLTSHWAEGLGLLAGSCKRISDTTPEGRKLKVPHVGWNQVEYCAGAQQQLTPLFKGIKSGSTFYFTHSYQGVPAHSSDVLATVTHAQSFACVVGNKRQFGVQFHPEKSSHNGLTVLRNFVELAATG